MKHASSLEPLESRIAPAAVLQLGGLNGRNGFTINGEALNGGAGESVSGAGDVNGDGFDDMIIGASFAAPNGVNSGASYLVFGKAGGFGAELELSALDGSNGFKITGEVAVDRIGTSVSGAGDVNGDGFDDLIVGAKYASTPNGLRSGASYVLFGKAGGFGAVLELSALDGSNGFKINGAAAQNEFGLSVSGAGDVNGDGFDDLIFGAAFAAPVGNKSGLSYIIFGKAGGFGAVLEVSALDGSNGFKINGAMSYDGFGTSVSGAGDVNGDGFDDLIIGAPGSGPQDSELGATYVIFGKAGGFDAVLELSALDGSNGFKIRDKTFHGIAGASVSGAGDVNGDGFDDLLIGAPYLGAGRYASTASYVVFGRAGGFDAVLELSALDGSNGFQIKGKTPYDAFGQSVSGAGDVNGDGFDDLLIGAPKTFPKLYDFGASYLVFGKKSGFDAVLELSALDGSNGFKIKGEVANDRMGSSVSGAGDVNGDGFDDLLIGAPGGNQIGKRDDHFGATYVIFGSARFRTNPHALALTEPDGDIVTIEISRGALSSRIVTRGPDGSIAMIDLTGFAAVPGKPPGSETEPLSLTITAQTPKNGGGDGLAAIGFVNAAGVVFKNMKVEGDVGAIDAGDGTPGKSAFKMLSANSIGLSAAPGAESMIAGTVGVLKIKNSIKGVLNVTGGLADDAGLSGSPVQAIKKVVIGKDIDGGLLRVSGDIGSVAVKGSVIGGADLSGIVVGGNAGKIRIGADLAGLDPDHPVTISALGTAGVSKQAKAVALKQVQIGGNVLNAEILAGYRRNGTAFNTDAGIGKIIVDGSWTASSAAAGVEDATGDGFGINDQLIAGGSAGIIARIAKITIAGAVTGTAAEGDHFGITAQQIGKLRIGPARQPLTVGNGDAIDLAPDFTMIDFA